MKPGELRAVLQALERRVAALERAPNRVDRFVSFHELLGRLGHPSRQQVYRRVAAGLLPRPTKPFGGKLYWRESDIDAVIAGTWRR